MIIPEEVGQKIDEIYELLVRADQKDHEIWFEYVLFSWQWWLGVILTIIPWTLWWIFRKKDSTGRLLCGGFFLISTSMLLDSFGTELGFWDYRYETLPFLPSFLPWDLTIIPVLFLFTVQFKTTISPILKAIFYSVVSSFIGEAVFEWLGYYEPINWPTLYSFPIHFFIYLIGHYLVTTNNFEVLEERHENR